MHAYHVSNATWAAVEELPRCAREVGNAKDTYDVSILPQDLNNVTNIRNIRTLTKDLTGKLFKL